MDRRTRRRMFVPVALGYPSLIDGMLSGAALAIESVLAPRERFRRIATRPLPARRQTYSSSWFGPRPLHSIVADSARM